MNAARRYLFLSALGLALLLALMEGFLQVKDSNYTRFVACNVVEKAHAETPREKVLAIRDYLRRHIRYQEAPHENRPFFRASASDTLEEGVGYCGEVSRTFICMANAVGLKAQRINLFGKLIHVVAEADLSCEGLVVVDCQNPPAIADLEPLDQVMQRGDYDDYSTLNLRRLGLSGLFSRVKLKMGGFFTYLLERPHALKAALWFALASVLLLTQGTRWLACQVLLWKGWVHITDKPRINKVAYFELS